KFIEIIAGRKSGTFHEFTSRKTAREAKYTRERNDENRRTAINLTNKNTVEFRIFAGTISGNIFQKNIEFVDALVEWTVPSRSSRLDMHDYRKFIQFISDR